MASEGGSREGSTDSPATITDAGSGADARPVFDASTDADTDANPDSGSDACTAIPGLVGWWRGEDTANDDTSSYGGAWTEGTANYVAGKSGRGFAINAAAGGGYVSVPDAPALRLTIPFSISVWVNTPGDNLRIVDKITNGVNDGYLLDLNGARQVRLISGQGYMQTAEGLTPNTWHHVVAVAAATNLRAIYLDGVLALETTLDRPGPTTPGVPLRFGANSEGTSRFPGLIDEVALFNRALAVTEVATIHTRGSASLCR